MQKYIKYCILIFKFFLFVNKNINIRSLLTITNSPVYYIFLIVFLSAMFY